VCMVIAELLREILLFIFLVTSILLQIYGIDIS